jgi:hypothetical protein
MARVSPWRHRLRRWILRPDLLPRRLCHVLPPASLPAAQTFRMLILAAVTQCPVPDASHLPDHGAGPLRHATRAWLET